MHLLTVSPDSASLIAQKHSGSASIVPFHCGISPTTHASPGEKSGGSTKHVQLPGHHALLLRIVTVPTLALSRGSFILPLTRIVNTATSIQRGNMTSQAAASSPVDAHVRLPLLSINNEFGGSGSTFEAGQAVFGTTRGLRARKRPPYRVGVTRRMLHYSQAKETVMVSNRNDVTL